jgi:hypothetical protein
MLILVLPVTTIVAALIGFYVWHRQLVRKRHFEVADAGLSAFYQAEAAIARVSQPQVPGKEQHVSVATSNYQLTAVSSIVCTSRLSDSRLAVVRSKNWSAPLCTLRSISAVT